MAQRFVIDINVNGEGGKGGNDSFLGGANAGSLAGSGTAQQFTAANQSAIAHQRFFEKEGFTNPNNFIIEESTMKKTRQGMFSADWEGKGLMDIGDKIQNIEFGVGEKMFQGSKAQEFLQTNKGKIKTLGTATAWKVANTTVDLKNYKSGDSYANAKRSNQMKMASYGAVLVGTGFNPFVIAGIAGNEAINAYSENAKYNYDRKLERSEITNITQIAGNISYGRNRGGK